MDYIKLIINVVAIFIGLLIYILISHTKWGKKHEAHQYAIMLFSMFVAIILGGILHWVI